MKKNNWFRKHEKTVVMGACAALLGISGLTGYHLQDAQAKAYAWLTEDGEMEIMQSYPEEDVQVSEDTAVEIAEGTAGDAQRSYGKVSQEATVETDDSVGEYSGYDIYEALGLVWNSGRYWTWQGKAVAAVWIEDGSFSTWGKVPEENSVYLYITREAEKDEVTFHIREMEWEDFRKLYNSKSDGSYISRE